MNETRPAFAMEVNWLRIIILISCFFFAIGCATKSTKYQKITVNIPIKHRHIPEYARSLSLKIQFADHQFKSITKQNVVKLVSRKLQRDFPQLKIDEKNSDIQIHGVVSTNLEKTTKLVKELKFRHNLAHLPYHEQKTVDIYRGSYNIQVKVSDSQAKYTFIKKSIAGEFFAASFDQEMERTCTNRITNDIFGVVASKTKHKKIELITNSAISEKVLATLKQKKVDEALQILNRNIDRLHYDQNGVRNKILGICYFNRSQILRSLNRIGASERDMRRAKVILE